MKEGGALTIISICKYLLHNDLNKQTHMSTKP